MDTPEVTSDDYGLASQYNNLRSEVIDISNRGTQLERIISTNVVSHTAGAGEGNAVHYPGNSTSDDYKLAIDIDTSKYVVDSERDPGEVRYYFYVHFKRNGGSDNAYVKCYYNNGSSSVTASTNSNSITSSTLEISPTGNQSCWVKMYYDAAASGVTVYRASIIVNVGVI